VVVEVIAEVVGVCSAVCEGDPALEVSVEVPGTTVGISELEIESLWVLTEVFSSETISVSEVVD